MANYEGVSPSMAKGTHGWSLSAAVTDSLSGKPHRKWPTPAARDWKGARKLETLKAKGRKASNSLPDAVAATENSSKFMTINADWVEWLMGYSQGYTDLEAHIENNHPGFNEEPEISRVVHKQKDKRNRLRSLGNSIVPQIAYNLGLGIIEDYEQNPPKK